MFRWMFWWRRKRAEAPGPHAEALPAQDSEQIRVLNERRPIKLNWESRGAALRLVVVNPKPEDELLTTESGADESEIKPEPAPQPTTSPTEISSKLKPHVEESARAVLDSREARRAAYFTPGAYAARTVRQPRLIAPDSALRAQGSQSPALSPKPAQSDRTSGGRLSHPSAAQE
jgi:hypothetical protein